VLALACALTLGNLLLQTKRLVGRQGDTEPRPKDMRDETPDHSEEPKDAAHRLSLDSFEWTSSPSSSQACSIR
jgi:hypothetical protein